MNFDQIRNHILANFPNVKEVYEPLAAGSKAPAPYVVVANGIETKLDDVLQADESIYIMVYCKTYSGVIELTKQIARNLNTHTNLVYQGTLGQPFYDEELQLWMHQASFTNFIIIKEV